MVYSVFSDLCLAISSQIQANKSRKKPRGTPPIPLETRCPSLVLTVPLCRLDGWTEDCIANMLYALQEWLMHIPEREVSDSLTLRLFDAIELCLVGDQVRTSRSLLCVLFLERMSARVCVHACIF